MATAYLLAYGLGCKGITIYRDGSKGVQVLNVGVKEKPEGKKEMACLRTRPTKLHGNTYRVQTPVGAAFVVINADEDGNPFEVFINVGKAGTHVMADAEAMGRLISLSLRVPSEYPPKAVAESVIDQLSGIGGADSVGFGGNRVRSLADGVAKVLMDYLKGNGGVLAKLVEEPDPVEPLGQQQALPLREKADLCPECGQAALVVEEGCMKCYACGASKC